MTTKLSTQLFCVTRIGYQNEEYTTVETLNELRSSLTRFNSIVSIRRAKLIIEDAEVNMEDIKPEKYKGKPYTYFEKKAKNGIK